ncbi:PhoX family protein [Streptomyces sp. NPDC059862]|uniref:PhoX family protein n=1 Tax=Streptomyces sp. NPDC059862 TaxID=3346975 RepID=UPI00365124CF
MGQLNEDAVRTAGAVSGAVANVPAGVSRRTILTTTAAVALSVTGTAGPAHAASGPGGAATPVPVPSPPFRAVGASTADRVTVPSGFRSDVLARWGDALTRSAPAWQPDAGGAGAVADAQTAQVGSHHHGVEFLPLTDGKGLLVLTHEAAPGITVSGAGAPRLAMAAQGVTVAAVHRAADGTWALAGSRFNRRITADTPVRLSGPAGGREARGVLAPGATGVTPWGTLLIAEENANAAFGTDSPDWRRDETAVRYGFSASGFGAPWHTADARFDLADEGARPEDQGWITELDPQDPASVPVKRTALGRFWHGAATVTEVNGRVVVYSTDAEDGEYLYRYVSARPWRTLRAQGEDPLDHGTLSVALFGANGSGRWLPLVFGSGPLTAGNGWRDQADVLVRARLAADAVGATPLARPERVAVHPGTGEVYLAVVGGTATPACTGHAEQGQEHQRAGSGGAAAAGQATGAGRYGRVVRWTETGGTRSEGGTFAWEVFLSGGDPALTPDGLFAGPKNLWFGTDGRLWISTGVPGHSLADGDDTVFAEVGNNALLVADTRTREVARFLVAPRGAEVAGASATPDGDALFVNIQHPGQRTRAWGIPTAADPRAVSSWPDGEAAARPRSATVTVRPA